MADTRSTRRIIKPESESPSISANTDFASVEGDDNASSVANNKLTGVGGPSDQEPARMQPPDSFQVNSQGDETAFDMDQLEAELNVAISAEMGVVAAEDPVDAPETTDSGSANEQSTDTLVTEKEIDETVRTVHTPVPEESTNPGSEGVRGVGLIFSLMMTPFAAPVERLPDGARMMLNFAAISLALWVPLVWLGAMTDGFGYLASSQNEVTGIVTPVTELEVVDSTSEPGNQDDLATD